ncbi:unnamed protein product, partial [Closterium sp. NIES-54]
GSFSLRRSCASGLPGAGAVLLELEVLLLLLVSEVLVLAVLELLGLGVLLRLLELVLLELLELLVLDLLGVLALELVLLELLQLLVLELLGVLALGLVLLEVLLGLLAVLELPVLLELALLELGVLLAQVLPLLVLVLSLFVLETLHGRGQCPQPVQSQSQLQPVSPLPAPSPYTGPTGVPGTHQMAQRPSTAPLRVLLPSPPESSLLVLADPASDSLRAASPSVARLLSTVVTDPCFESTTASALVAELVDFAARCRLDYAASLVAESASVFPPSVGGDCALSTDILEDRQEEFQCFAAALPHLVSTLISPEGDPDAPDIPTPRSYAEAIEGPYSSQWQSAMDVEMASLKSTGTYVDEVPPPGANIVSGMWIFRVKRPPGSPPIFKARYVARGFSQR